VRALLTSSLAGVRRPVVSRRLHATMPPHLILEPSCPLRCHPPFGPVHSGMRKPPERGLSLWARQDSNLGPTDYESAALTAELRAPRPRERSRAPSRRPPSLSRLIRGQARYISARRETRRQNTPLCRRAGDDPEVALREGVSS
jgi:hypothetical protein